MAPQEQAARRLLLAGLAAVSLAACSSRPVDLRIQTVATEVSPTQAMVMPPPGGPSIVSVVERRPSNGIQQELALSTVGYAPGQNAFYVSLRQSMELEEGDNNGLTIPSVAPSTIEGEMDDRLAGISMRVSPYFVQNKYGPFGYAAGRSAAGDTCIYAWQLIEPDEKRILGPRGSISVRLRLCEPGAPEEALLRVMYDYSIVAHLRDHDWNPYGSPPPLDPRLGETGSPVYPISRNGHTRPLATPVAAARPVVTRTVVTTRQARPVERTAPAPAPEPVEDRPVVGFPTVPPPP